MLDDVDVDCWKSGLTGPPRSVRLGTRECAVGLPLPVQQVEELQYARAVVIGVHAHKLVSDGPR